MNRQSKKPKKTKGLGAGIIAFGVVFALFSAIFHPHSLGGYILAFALSGLAGAVVKVMGEGLDVSSKVQMPSSLRNLAAETGNPEVDALLSKGRQMISDLHEENKQIKEPSLNATLTQLENQCAEVFRAVYDKPAKAPQIRKFMDYYLPTTLKLTRGYRVLGERNVAGQDSVAARRRIDEALGVVLRGCQKMLDNLYKDDVLDITTDIDVLEQMLTRDGLTESALQMAAQQAKQAAKIDQQVNDAIQQRAQATGQQTAAPAASQAGTAAPAQSALEKEEPSFYAQDGQAMAQAPQKQQE